MLIVDEVNAFRSLVRSQAKAAQQAKRQDTYVIDSRTAIEAFKP